MPIKEGRENTPSEWVYLEMNTKRQENSSSPLDTGLLSDFIFELTICSRCVTAYPSGHPFIKASLEKATNRIPQLFEFREEITLGVARETLVFDQTLLDKKNPVFKEYAKILFRHNIGALTFEKKIEFEELVHFNEILAASPDTEVGFPVVISEALRRG